MVPRYTGALVCKATGFLRAQNLPAPFFLWITRLRKKCFEKMNLQANSVLDFRQKNPLHTVERIALRSQKLRH